MPKISIIVPIYNAENSIENCAVSILNQTYRDISLLLVDDGSTDRSGAICDALAKTDARVKVIHQPNSGVSAARNRGLDEASGEYIMFCDCDDTVSTDWCEKLLLAMEAAQADLSICGYRVIKNGKTVWENSWPEEPRACTVSQLLKCNLLNSPCNKLFRRELIEAHKLRYDPTMQYAEDQVFNLHYIQHCGGLLVCVKEHLYNYFNDNSNSASSCFVPNLWEQRRKSLTLLQQTLEQTEQSFAAIAPEFFDYCIDVVIRVLNNNMREESGESVRQRIARNSAILRAPLVRNALKSAAGNSVSPYYLALMRLGNYRFIYFAEKRIHHRTK